VQQSTLDVVCQCTRGLYSGGLRGAVALGERVESGATQGSRAGRYPVSPDPDVGHGPRDAKRRPSPGVPSCCCTTRHVAPGFPAEFEHAQLSVELHWVCRRLGRRTRDAFTNRIQDRPRPAWPRRSLHRMEHLVSEFRRLVDGDFSVGTLLESDPGEA
jgi:hypothetical protein